MLLQTKHQTASASLAFIWGMVGFCLFSLLVLVWFKVSGTQVNSEGERGNTRLHRLRTLERENRQKLTTYGWVDEEKGVIQIPIDRAMELVMHNAKLVKVSTVQVEPPKITPIQTNATASGNTTEPQLEKTVPSPSPEVAQKTTVTNQAASSPGPQAAKGTPSPNARPANTPEVKK